MHRKHSINPCLATSELTHKRHRSIRMLLASLLRCPSGFLFVIFLFISSATESPTSSPIADLLNLGDTALASDDPVAAIDYYRRAIASLTVNDSIVHAISVYTNLGTALSSVGNNVEAAESYNSAVHLHSDSIGEVADAVVTKEANDIAAQAAFFLGMVHQDLGNMDKAAHAYALSYSLDQYHWSSIANLGALLQDELRQPSEAIEAYNKAIEILTQTEVEPTDAPNEPRYILSQLQHRVGMTIVASPDRKCAMHNDPTTPVDCIELAANAFSLAINYDPNNEAAKHMLASVTADATMKRASNTYVTALFDDYATNFERSLVSDLKYNGYERLRFGFDKAFGGQARVPMFSRVVDAGCGTGLAGEQFRNISEHLIGVDLSHAIIEEAQKARPGLYNETRVGDVCDVFREMKPISLIIAADAYIYFGDLVPLFESMEDSLEDGGFVAFTLENVNKENEEALHVTKPEWRWQLTASGRFAHKKKYVEDVGEQHSLHTVHYEPLIDFRFENGVGVPGHIFVMKKVRDDEHEL